MNINIPLCGPTNTTSNGTILQVFCAYGHSHSELLAGSSITCVGLSLGTKELPVSNDTNYDMQDAMTGPLLLINPWIYDFAAYDFWNKPLGLLYLASFLRANGYAVVYVDCLDPFHPALKNSTDLKQPRRRSSGTGHYPVATIPRPAPLKSVPRTYHRYGITPKMFTDTLERIPPPSLIMVTSMMTYWYPGVWDAIELAQRKFPGVPVVLGGNYVTLAYNHALMSKADFCLTGPADKSLPALLKELFNEDINKLPGESLDSHPYPAFDLVRCCDQVPIMTSRGCPYRCSYCASHLINPSFTRRDPIRVVDEIEHWYHSLGVRHFSFYDDALLIDAPSMIIPLLQEVIRRDIKAQFHCPNGLHLREITPVITDLLFRAGFKTLRFGFETSNLTRQVRTGGKVINEELQEALRLLEISGYRREEIGIYLLCGLPGQPFDEVRQSITFVRSCGARPFLAEFSPIPGTELWTEAVTASPFPISIDPIFQNNSLLPCRSQDLTPEQYRELKEMTLVS